MKSVLAAFGVAQGVLALLFALARQEDDKLK
jgi:hypothetical protein